MGLFVGAARLNACHNLADRLGRAEPPIGVKERSPNVSRQTHNYTDAHLSVTQTAADLQRLLSYH